MSRLKVIADMLREEGLGEVADWLGRPDLLREALEQARNCDEDDAWYPEALARRQREVLPGLPVVDAGERGLTGMVGLARFLEMTDTQPIETVESHGYAFHLRRP